MIKATFPGDEKEPKAKHVICNFLLYLDLINCFKNRVAEIRRKEAFSKIFKKFLEELGSWVHTAKVYTIFHVALQDQVTARPIALELKERESHIYAYSKNPGSRDYSNLEVTFS